MTRGVQLELTARRPRTLVTADELSTGDDDGWHDVHLHGRICDR